MTTDVERMLIDLEHQLQEAGATIARHRKASWPTSSAQPVSLTWARWTGASGSNWPPRESNGTRSSSADGRTRRGPPWGMHDPLLVRAEIRGRAFGGLPPGSGQSVRRRAIARTGGPRSEGYLLSARMS